MALVRAIVICAVLGLTIGKNHGSRSSESLVNAIGDNALFDISQVSSSYTDLSWEFLQHSLMIISVTDGVTNTNPEYKDRITLLEDGSLELRNLKESDTGGYIVNFTLTGGSEFSIMFSLNVLRPVTDVQLSASTIELIEGRSVILTCSANGSDLLFSLYNQTHCLVEGSPWQEFTLRMKRYDRSFKCEAYNQVSRASSEWVNFTIYYGPDVTLTVFPLKKYYTWGSEVTLTCTVVSKPEAEITWTFLEDLLPFNGTELVVDYITWDLTGGYRCKAYNRKTEQTKDQYTIISGESSPDPGLSPSAITAIVLGCNYALWAVVGLTLLIYRKRMRRRAR